jgi:DNA-binding MarR family transcriptional regulator
MLLDAECRGGERPEEAIAAMTRLPTRAESNDAGNEETRLQLRGLIGFKLGEAYLQARRTFKARMANLAVTPLEYWTLSLLGVESVHQAKLSAALNVPAQNMTVVLERMGRRGLLVRVQSDVDRRAQMVRLTKAGRLLLRQADEVMHVVEHNLVAPLTAGERILLSELLDKIASAEPSSAARKHPTEIDRAREQ